MKFHIIILLLIILGSTGVAYGHTVDSVGDYRVEIGWMNEPVVSGETNALEFYASPLISCPEILESLLRESSDPFNETGKEPILYSLFFSGESL